jgi:prepilin-type N-terminal cleavage/methylation domain-containing protein
LLHRLPIGGRYEEGTDFDMLKLSRRRHSRRGAFTLIELLIVILILAILMAVALPLYLAAVNDSEVKTCRANMQTIANAEAAYKTANSTHTYTTNIANLASNIGSLSPVCPTGGAYSVAISTGTSVSNSGLAVPAGGIVISCTSAGHGIFAPGIDSQ